MCKNGRRTYSTCALVPITSKPLPVYLSFAALAGDTLSAMSVDLLGNNFPRNPVASDAAGRWKRAAVAPTVALQTKQPTEHRARGPGRHPSIRCDLSAGGYHSLLERLAHLPAG